MYIKIYTLSSNQGGHRFMNICVYGASSIDLDKKYIEEGELLGKKIAEDGHTLIFGGGNNGMMGAAARGADSKGGEIIGIAPIFFNVDGILYNSKTLIRPETMRERKKILEDKSDAFIITAGGIGTMDEFFEILTLKQLGRHCKPVVILNSYGFYDKMLEMLDFYIAEKVLYKTVKNLYYVTDNVSDAMDYISNYEYEQIDPSKYKRI